MAQDLTATGVELPALMTAGRWKSAKMPARYTEREAADRGVVARYYEGGLMLRDATDKRGFESSTVGQHVIAGVTHRLVRVFHTGNRQLTSRNHRLDTGMGFGLAGVDGLDAGVGVGTAEHLPVQQSAHLEVTAVLGPAGDFVGPVRTDGPGANHVVIRVGQDNIRRNQPRPKRDLDVC